MSFISEEPLREMFDARATRLAIQFHGAETSNPKDVPEIRTIGFPEPGLTLLLGRNGSGKTILLEGIYALCGSGRHDFPHVGALYDVPTPALLSEWKNILAEIANENIEMPDEGLGIGTSGEGNPVAPIEKPQINLQELKKIWGSSYSARSGRWNSSLAEGV
jgi:hypothetical protein